MLDAYLPILLTPAVLFVLGLLIGSFLNVVIHRLPLMLERQWKQDARDMLELGEADDEGQPLSLSRPASRCPACGHQIRWYENIPLISWLMLGGKCSGCGTRISWRYPLVELATGLLFAACAWQFGPHPVTLAWCAVVAVLVAASMIDWDTTLLPDDLTLPLMWAGLVVAGLGWNPDLPLKDALWGAVGGYLSLWTVYWVFKKATGKEGMGYGDFKLLAALGAWLGWKMLLPIILISSVIGAVVGIILKLQSSLREGMYVPYGPFLAGAGLVVLFAGEARVLDWFGW
jgi:leader peptidase (prepilin peptidase)/N-methyltransferase